MSDDKLHIIGTSADTDLNAAAITALQQADIIIGSEHQFACVEQHLAHSSAQRHAYPTPLSNLKTLIGENADHKTVLLASGDPLFYGIGAWLGRNFSADKLAFHPNTSSIQSAFARIGKAWQNAEVVSLHGRPLISLRAALKSHSLYAVLTDAKSSPEHIATELIEQGFADADCWVCEDLGGSDEQVRAFTAQQLSQARDFHVLNVVIIETHQNLGHLPECPGIADEHFITGAEPGKGMLSKREVRLNILSLLSPQAGETGWDIGAGCGGVAVEWARWNPSVQVHAIEYSEQRLPHLNANRDRFGVVKNLNIIEGTAPAALADLPAPDAVFVGGSAGDLDSILNTAWSRLKSDGRLVCAAVTEDSRYQLYQFAEQLQRSKSQIKAEWVEISVAKGDSLAGRLLLRPQLPVLLVKWVKG